MIPIGDNNPRRSRPVVNYVLIALNFVVFIYMLGLSTDLAPGRRQQDDEFISQTNGDCYGFRTAPTDADRFICQFAFQPKEFFDTVRGQSLATNPNTLLVLFSILTAAFLHGGWLHIFGNMVFLWVFGDNIEDRLGRVKYLLFYLAAAVIASLIQGLVAPDSVVPTVGASGAVAGVLGAYLVWFPKARIRVVIPIVFLVFIPFQVPAIVMIGLWFAQNLFSGYATITSAADSGGGVAWFAHIGGFVFGAAVALLLYGRRGKRTAWGGRT